MRVARSPACDVCCCSPHCGPHDLRRAGRTARKGASCASTTATRLSSTTALRVFLAEIDAPRGEARLRGAIARRTGSAGAASRRAACLWRRAALGRPAARGRGTAPPPKPRSRMCSSRAKAGAGSGCSTNWFRAARLTCARGRDNHARSRRTAGARSASPRRRARHVGPARISARSPLRDRAWRSQRDSVRRKTASRGERPSDRRRPRARRACVRDAAPRSTWMARSPRRPFLARRVRQKISAPGTGRSSPRSPAPASAHAARSASIGDEPQLCLRAFSQLEVLTD